MYLHIGTQTPLNTLDVPILHLKITMEPTTSTMDLGHTIRLSLVNYTKLMYYQAWSSLRFVAIEALHLNVLEILEHSLKVKTFSNWT